MKLWVMSDLHLEVAPLERPLDVPDADVCIVAGDLCRGVAKGIAYMAKLLDGRMPCICVAGNHEYWGSSIEHEIQAGRAATKAYPGLHFLEEDAVLIDGVRFVGATLWTDFRIRGHQRLAMAESRQVMRDYRRISLSKKPWTRFTPEVSARLHARSRSFIENAVRHTDKSVIVTHHAPHAASLACGEDKPLIDAAYASDLESSIRSVRPSIWIHGHTHVPRDYMVGDTRVVSNPRGYPDQQTSFQRSLVITV